MRLSNNSIFILAACLAVSSTSQAFCLDRQVPFHLGDVIFDSPPYEEGREFLHRPQRIREQYQQDAMERIAKSYFATNGRQPIENSDAMLMITISRSGKILKIKELCSGAHKLNSKVLSKVVQSVRATELPPVPDNYLEDDLTFKFDLCWLAPDGAVLEIPDDSGPKLDQSSKINSQLWWSSLPADPKDPLFGPGLANALESDSSPEMKLAWESWRRRIHDEISKRVEKFVARAAFHYNSPMECEVLFTVTKDAHVIDVRVKKASSNVLYNVLIQQAVRSLDGDSKLLQFPPGSSRLQVEETFQGRRSTKFLNWGDLIYDERLPASGAQ